MVEKIDTGVRIRAAKAGTSGGDSTFVHDESIPSDRWTVRHGLNKYPAVTVVDSAGTEVIGGVEDVDKNTVILTFSGEFSGQAFFN